ncbi:MAG TPA: cytochrome c-type biogenesis protein CcmH [Acidimicrobiia bacterium]|nr:cytochrome c-type biogenesis protein CcmH [Acidimicrobiia bacterium]
MPERARRLAWLVVPVLAIIVIVVGLWPGDQAAADPEARAYSLTVRLKCPICAGESLAGSQTDLAKDLRIRIDEEIAAGSTDDEIIAMFVAAYGEQIVLDPPNTGWGVALWAVPLGIAIVGGFAIYGLKRKNRDPSEVSK